MNEAISNIYSGKPRSDPDNIHIHGSSVCFTREVIYNVFSVSLLCGGIELGCEKLLRNIEGFAKFLLEFLLVLVFLNSKQTRNVFIFALYCAVHLCVVQCQCNIRNQNKNNQLLGKC